MANQARIEQIKKELKLFSDTLARYQNQFRADGYIDPREQAQIDRMNTAIAKINARLVKEGGGTPTPAPAPRPTPTPNNDEQPTVQLSDNPTALSDKKLNHRNTYVYKDVTEQHYSKITELYKTGKVGSADANSDVHWNDVAQGELGDCYFLSAIGAVAKADPGLLKKLIKGPFKDGSYEVTLHIKDAEKFDWRTERKPETVRVTSEFLVYPDGSPIYAKGGDAELWVMLLEKAYSILRKDQFGKGEYVAKLGDGYDKLDGGWGEEGIEVLTGKEATAHKTSSLSVQQLATQISSALRDKRPITTATIQGPKKDVKANALQIEAQNQGLVLGHEYFIINFDGSNVTVQNPWNNEVVDGDGGGDLTFSLALYKRYYEGVTFQNK